MATWTKEKSVTVQDQQLYRLICDEQYFVSDLTGNEADEAITKLNTFDAVAAERDRLREVNAELVEIVRLGYELSTWTACINWRGKGNEKEWLDALRLKIEQFQPLAQAAIAKAAAPAQPIPANAGGEEL